MMIQDQPVRTKLVRDVMQKNVVSARPDMSVRELIHLLLDNSIHGVPVLDDQRKPVGVVSMTDVLQLAAHDPEIPAGQLDWEPVIVQEELSGDDDITIANSLVAFTEPAAESVGEAAFDDYRVRDIMTPVAFALSPGDTIETAVAFMLRGRIHRALVVNDGAVEGIITPFDVLRALEW